MKAFRRLARAIRSWLARRRLRRNVERASVVRMPAPGERVDEGARQRLEQRNRQRL